MVRFRSAADRDMWTLLLGSNIELSSVILTVHWRYYSEKRIRFQGVDYARLSFFFFFLFSLLC
ncbi:hypothetical protein BDV39DRAFT_175585 [Aspergillus sergii]|uniref:Uncharacterized protein n=1 Tax=Aspergillus sergii TaxID=1034303 RepID=A0A5N6X5M2_9EURO|nr:hypothetical protein BDV39DRAFT_175585 [Aspergillus sergii]